MENKQLQEKLNSIKPTTEELQKLKDFRMQLNKAREKMLKGLEKAKDKASDMENIIFESYDHIDSLDVPREDEEE